MCSQDHSFGVDHFALGVIAYELMMGKVFCLLFRDHIKGKIDHKLDKLSSQSKYKFQNLKFLHIGQCKL